MRSAPTPQPLPPVQQARWRPAKSSHAIRPDFHDGALTHRDAAHLLGDPEVLRWARAH